MHQKKILIISRTIFPSQNPRSFRATELAKELSLKGHKVIIYAVLGKFDYSYWEKENNLKVNNIGKMWFAKLNSVDTGNRTILDKILVKIFSKLIDFPDIELMFRMPLILKKEKNIDMLISVAFPHSIHWGLAMTRSFAPKTFPNIWIADCGDPYMGNKFFKTKPFFYFKYLEKWFCKKSDFISVPTQNIVSAYYPEFQHKIRVIPQGFNFNIGYNTVIYNKNTIPTFAYAGIFYSDKRDPSSFLNFLLTVKAPFKFIIYTPSISIIEPFLPMLKNKIEIRSHIPREKLIKELKCMDFLVNIDNIGNYGSPSKLIDYAISGRPILSFTSDSIPKDTFIEFLQGDYSNQFIVKNIEQYRIENVAKSFLELLADKCEGNKTLGYS